MLFQPWISTNFHFKILEVRDPLSPLSIRVESVLHWKWDWNQRYCFFFILSCNVPRNRNSLNRLRILRRGGLIEITESFTRTSAFSDFLLCLPKKSKFVKVQNEHTNSQKCQIFAPFPSLCLSLSLFLIFFLSVCLTSFVISSISPDSCIKSSSFACFQQLDSITAPTPLPPPLPLGPVENCR